MLLECMVLIISGSIKKHDGIGIDLGSIFKSTEINIRPKIVCIFPALLVEGFHFRECDKLISMFIWNNRI